MRDTLASEGITSSRGLRVRCGNTVVNKVFPGTDDCGKGAVDTRLYKASPLTKPRARSHDPVIGKAYDKVFFFSQCHYQVKLLHRVWSDEFAPVVARLTRNGIHACVLQVLRDLANKLYKEGKLPAPWFEDWQVWAGDEAAVRCMKYARVYGYTAAIQHFHLHPWGKHEDISCSILLLASACGKMVPPVIIEPVRKIATSTGSATWFIHTRIAIFSSVICACSTENWNHFRHGDSESRWPNDFGTQRQRWNGQGNHGHSPSPALS